MSGSTVLIVDDERTLARAIKAFLTESGYEAEVAGDAEQALRLLETMRPDVVFTDVRLPGMDGIELLRRIREFDAAIPVIIMTAHGTIEGAVEAVKLGAFDYLKKPVDLEELKLLADRAREHSQLRQELSYYRRRDAARETPLAGVIGESPSIREVLDQARQIAALDETPPVLIIGETGTGKGLVARTIHGASPRAGKPFIEVNCTALPATLMEAELFGHERGAFTDAKESRMGLFEAADGGFLFLDEVGDVELSLQGKLLKAVEDRTVRRVGGIRDRRIDVRILAATNRDLERDAQRETLPPGPLLPAGRDHPAPAAAPRAGQRHPAPGPALPRAVQRQVREGRATDRRARPGAAGRVSLAGQRARAEPRDRARGALEPRADAGRRAPLARHARRAGPAAGPRAASPACRPCHRLRPPAPRAESIRPLHRPACRSTSGSARSSSRRSGSATATRPVPPSGWESAGTRCGTGSRSMGFSEGRVVVILSEAKEPS